MQMYGVPRRRSRRHVTYSRTSTNGCSAQGRTSFTSTVASTRFAGSGPVIRRRYRCRSLDGTSRRFSDAFGRAPKRRSPGLIRHRYFTSGGIRSTPMVGWKRTWWNTTLPRRRWRASTEYAPSICIDSFMRAGWSGTWHAMVCTSLRRVRHPRKGCRAGHPAGTAGCRALTRRDRVHEVGLLDILRIVCYDEGAFHAEFQGIARFYLVR